VIWYSLKGHGLYVGFLLGLFIFGYDYPWLWVGVGGGLFVLFRYDRLLSYASIAVLALYAVMRCLHPGLTPAHTTVMFEGTLTEVKVYEHSQRYTVQKGSERYYLFSTETFEIPQTVRVKGVTQTIDGPTFPGAFDYPKYLKAIGVRGILEVESIETLTLLDDTVRSQIEQRIHRTTLHYQPYIQALVMADRSYFDPQFATAVSTLGLMHLFAVSGLHVTFLATVLRVGLKKLRFPLRGCDLVVALVLGSYLYVTAFAPSVVRAVFWWLGLRLNERLKDPLTSLDVLVGVLIGVWLWQPYAHGHSGFLLSYTLALCLMLSQPYLKGSTFAASFKVAWMAFFFSLPILTQMHPAVHPLSPLINTFSVFAMSLVLLPLTYTVFIFPFLDAWLGFIPHIFTHAVIGMHRLLPLSLSFYIPPGAWTVLYYGACVACLRYGLNHERSKAVWLGSVTLALFFFRAFLRPFSSFVMYDVQGDAFLIEERFHRCVMVVDTGDIDRHESLTMALKRRGIHWIDVVFLTHNHRDHVGGYPSLAEHFKIRQVITPMTQKTLENTWQHCGSVAYFIYPNDLEKASENDRSLIIKLVFEGDRYLLTGDIERERERSFIEKHQPDVNILKAAHHGSLTSSTEVFLDHFDFEDVLIPAHRRNRFDFPNPSIIERYEARGYALHRTDLEGTILWHYWGPWRFKKNHAP